MNNQVNFIGRVGQNPTLTSFTDTDNKLAKFSLAVADYSSKTDNPDPMWIDVESWNGLAERVMKLITEGREVGITGRLSISKFNKEINGVKVEMRRPVVKLSGFHLCGAKPKSQEQGGEVKTPAPKRSKVAA
jgi:single-stranded DNA-binding protein